MIMWELRKVISHSPHVNTHQYRFLRGMWGLLADCYTHREKGPLMLSQCWVTFFFFFNFWNHTKKSCGAKTKDLKISDQHLVSLMMQK